MGLGSATEFSREVNMPMIGADEREVYDLQGVLRGFKVFEADEVARFNREYERLVGLLPDGKTVGEILNWHDHDRFLYELVSEARILDYVEDLLGPDFYVWGSQFFSKAPHDETPVHWHQDAFYWPLTPPETVTVWIAFGDSSVENGCMQVVPGSHRAGMLKHREASGQSTGLWIELEGGQFLESDAMNVELKAGEISLHDDHMVHGSGGNFSDRARVGLAVRYSPTHVKCDTTIWPKFVSHLVRGEDRYGHNPKGEPPVGALDHYVQVLPLTAPEVRHKLLEMREAGMLGR